MVIYKFLVNPNAINPKIKIETYECEEKPSMFITKDKHRIAKKQLGVLNHAGIYLTMWDLGTDTQFFRIALRKWQTQEYNKLKKMLDENLEFGQRIDTFECVMVEM